MRAAIILLIFAFSAFTVGCSSVSSTVAGDNKNRPEGSVYDDNDYFTSLADYLRKVPGVNISGSGMVTIRGMNSFDTTYSPITPLFVIDGIAVGYSYHEANRMVHPLYIDYVKVLKGPDATIYGSRGGNGVIEIVTRKM